MRNEKVESRKAGKSAFFFLPITESKKVQRTEENIRQKSSRGGAKDAENAKLMFESLCRPDAQGLLQKSSHRAPIKANTNCPQIPAD